MKLHLSVKREYFEQIRDGLKPFEYRLTTDYWAKRLIGRHYDAIVFAWGYPPKSDTSRRIVTPWQGYEIQTITHPHFGVDPVEVFAIRVV